MNKSPDGHQELRAQLAKLLRMKEDRDPFDYVWECLVEDKYVAEWERGESSEDEIIQEAEHSLDRYRRAREGTSSRTGQKQERRVLKDIPVEPTERERDMTDALRKYLAAHAAQRPIVQKFRREYLPHGRLLTKDEDISRLLAEQLVVEVGTDVQQYLDSHRSKPAGESAIEVPFDLRAEPPRDDDSGRISYEDWAGILAEEASEQERQMGEEWWGIGWEKNIPGHDDPAEVLTDEERDQEKQQEKGWEGYFGWQLETLGEWLADKYPWENVGDAAVFLISGRPPRLAEPLSAAHNVGNETYSITFSLWVSEETVLRAYRTIQSAHRRPPGGKTLRVLHFVSEQTDQEGALPPWSELLDRWNEANPNERFSDRSALRRAYRRAVEALVPPYLPLA